MADSIYDARFFAFHEESSRGSAREVVPEVLRFLQPKSVVDVGCGIGTWLAEFAAAGVPDVLGIDGDYVDRSMLLIDRQQFVSRDLARPLALERRFDLAVSLEVAEHLPPEAAATFVESLTSLAPVVLFSAAIPFQHGSGHVNEQFPEYWRERFAVRGFVVVDALRMRIWNHDNIAPWYRQNMLFFVDARRLRGYPRLAEIFDRDGRDAPLSLVHPGCYTMLRDWLIGAVREAQQHAMRSIARLREINLVTFPDWSQPTEVIAGEIRSLLTALTAHPQRRSITVVFNVGGEHEETAQRLLGSMVEAVVHSNGRDRFDNPEIAGVGRSFGPGQWEILMGCVQWRVGLLHEDPCAVAAAKAEGLPAVSLTAIEAGWSFA